MSTCGPGSPQQLLLLRRQPRQGHKPCTHPTQGTASPNPPPATPALTSQLGPLRAVEGTAEIAGCLSAAGLVGILALCLTLYGAAQFQSKPTLGVKTLSGRSIQRDSLQSADGWSGFTAGWLVGGLGGVAWAYVCTQVRGGRGRAGCLLFACRLRAQGRLTGLSVV